MNGQNLVDESNAKTSENNQNQHTEVIPEKDDTPSDEKDKSLCSNKEDSTDSTVHSNGINSEDEAENFEEDVVTNTSPVKEQEQSVVTTAATNAPPTTESNVASDSASNKTPRSRKKLVLSSEDEGPHTDHFDKQEDLILKVFKETEPKDNDDDLEKLKEKYKVEQLPEKIEQQLRKKEFRIEKTEERLRVEKQEERERKKKEKEMEQKRKAWTAALKQKQKEEERKKNSL